jgi:hypothetical protein
MEHTKDTRDNKDIKDTETMEHPERCGRCVRRAADPQRLNQQCSSARLGRLRISVSFLASVASVSLLASLSLSSFVSLVL